MIARYGISIAIGASVTFGLLFLMQLLIESGRGNLEATPFKLTDFVRVEREEIVQSERDKPEKPPEPENRPELPSPDADNFDSSLAISVNAPTMTTGLDLGGMGSFVSDGEYLPIVKVAPIYPSRAQARGLEGYVIVEYTVTRTGTTRDIFVIESTSSLFDRAAMDSAGKYKYRPRVINGVAVEVPGVRTRITFELED